MTDPQAKALIDKLHLVPHPEGGWYSETWRGGAEPGERAAATAIHFLLEQGQSSHWHKVDATEIWLWHAGSPLLLSTAPGDDGPVSERRLGGDVLAGEVPQHVIAPHHWQAAEADRGWALVSCIVSPGFDFAGFVLAAAGLGARQGLKSLLDKPVPRRQTCPDTRHGGLGDAKGQWRKSGDGRRRHIGVADAESCPRPRLRRGRHALLHARLHRGRLEPGRRLLHGRDHRLLGRLWRSPSAQHAVAARPRHHHHLSRLHGHDRAHRRSGPGLRAGPDPPPARI